MKTVQTRLQHLGPAIRKKPGMYFGRSGSAAITEMVKLLALWLAGFDEEAKAGTLSIEVKDETDSVEVTMLLEGEGCERFATKNPADWFSEAQIYSAAWMVAGASSEMTIDASIKDCRIKVITSDEHGVRTARRRPTTADRVRIVFQPHPASFGSSSDDELGRMAGILEDIAILAPGLSVRLTSSNPKRTFAWTYPRGLRDWLMKRDHSRWPLHPGTLSFSDDADGMQVEGHLRFLHAGVSEMRSWVNGHPTQGGAHFEGLGDVLRQLFPDPDRGCRRVPFAVNSDEESLLWLPHCFVGAMRLKVPDPRYAGPTKDILLGEAVREFVRPAAAKTLPQQWAAAQNQRP